GRAVEQRRGQRRGRQLWDEALPNGPECGRGATGRERPLPAVAAGAARAARGAASLWRQGAAPLRREEPEEEEVEEEEERESERLCMQNHGSSTGSVTLATAVSNKHSLSNTCCAPRRGGSRQDLVLGQAALPHRPRFIEDRDFEVLARTLNERQSSLAGKGCISQGGRTKAGKTSVIWRAL
ncbi:unnamed protein product, partial [Prorocentrum cordatum]